MTRFQRISPTTIAVWTGLLFFLLPVLNALRFGHFGVMQFFESDTFYYLDVARFSQHVPFFSFDGLQPTNGFHPLWQWIEFVCVKIGFFPLANNWKTLTHLFYLDLVVLSLAVAVLAWFSAQRLRQTWLVLWIFCPGLLWVFLSHGWSFFCVWNDLNGMETGVELFFFALTLAAFLRHEKTGSSPSLVLGNLLAGFLLLARLDDVFFLLPLTLFSLSSRRPSSTTKLLASALPYLMLAAYLFYNWHSLGILMPISGKHKAGLVLRAQLVNLARYLLPIHAWSRRFSVEGNMEIGSHLYQMVIPALLSALFLGWRWRKGAPRRDLMVCLACGVILKALYNFAFVDIMLQGHWYYGPSVIFGNLLLVLALDRLISQGRVHALFPRWGESVPALLSSVVSVFTFGVLMQYFPPEADAAFYRVQNSAQELRGLIDGFGDKRFLEFDDGEIAFASGIPSVSGFGLTGDPESVHALEAGSFLPLMERRGVTLIGVGANYRASTGDISYANAPSGMWGGLKRSELQHFRWRYLANTKDVYFYRLEHIR